MDDRSTYDLKSIRLPRFAGIALRLFIFLIESPATRWLLLGNLLKQGGITSMRAMRFDEAPTFLPRFSVDPKQQPRKTAARELGERPLARLAPKTSGWRFPSVADYAKAYRTKSSTPLEVAERVLDAMHRSNAQEPPLRAMIAYNRDDILTQANASALRHKRGRPLSVLDGVPIAVKDEMDLVPYPTKVGTRFMGTGPAKEDATIAARLRAAGALLIGKANMHEIGIGVTGHNPHNGTARNPYNLGHYTGGSSSGPASATAAGLCPAALGADGGGSIRFPAAFCGLVGLKTTFGRTSSFGAAPLSWSNDQLCPIGACTADVALLYLLTAGPDPRDPNTLAQPHLSLEGLERRDLRGIRLGVYWPWFEHATPSVVAACKEMLEALTARGARVVEVVIPELEAGRVGHIVSITSEMATAQERYWPKHWKEYSYEVRTNLTLARSFTARDYLQALRARTRVTANFMTALEHVDAIVTPTTACVAPRIPADALPDGDSDLTTLLQIMRFAPVANFTGLPAISFPAGYDSEGMPIGFQAIGRPWQEHVLLRLAQVGESVVERRKPQLFFPLLGEE
ncbi:MAG TPA: amidase [Anaerolineales bacterium]|nr:amidase [Anaerolineales bacterium]